MPAAFNHRRGLLGPVFLGYEADAANVTDTLTINKPSAVANGDLLIAVMGDNASGGCTWTGATGWTERIDQGALPNIRVATKTASSEGASYTFTASSAIDGLGGIVLAFRGAAYDAIGSVVTRYDNGNLVVTGYTSAGGLSLLFVYVDADSGQTISTPTGYVQIAAYNNASSTMKVFQAVVAAGATASATSTIGGATADTSGGVQIGVKPS